MGMAEVDIPTVVLRLNCAGAMRGWGPAAGASEIRPQTSVGVTHADAAHGAVGLAEAPADELQAAATTRAAPAATKAKKTQVETLLNAQVVVMDTPAKTVGPGEEHAPKEKGPGLRVVEVVASKKLPAAGRKAKWHAALVRRLKCRLEVEIWAAGAVQGMASTAHRLEARYQLRISPAPHEVRGFATVPIAQVVCGTHSIAAAVAQIHPQHARADGLCSVMCSPRALRLQSAGMRSIDLAKLVALNAHEAEQVRLAVVLEGREKARAGATRASIDNVWGGGLGDLADAFELGDGWVRISNCRPLKATFDLTKCTGILWISPWGREFSSLVGAKEHADSAAGQVEARLASRLAQVRQAGTFAPSVVFSLKHPETRAQLGFGLASYQATSAGAMPSPSPEAAEFELPYFDIESIAAFAAEGKAVDGEVGSSGGGFAPGASVEVSMLGEGLCGCKYGARILQLRPLCVHAMFEDFYEQRGEGRAGPRRVQEWIARSKISAPPPSPTDNWLRRVPLGELLELHHERGWWPVLLMGRQPKVCTGGTSFFVASHCYPMERRGADTQELRPSTVAPAGVYSILTAAQEQC